MNILLLFLYQLLNNAYPVHK